VKLTDAHCHLQDPRLKPHLDQALGACQGAGIHRWVVNGTRESDWPAVCELAGRIHGMEAAFGLHPWWQAERSEEWLAKLEAHLVARPSAGIGETGLDRWMTGYDLPDQIEVLRAHLELSRRLCRPVSLHCLRAWSELAAVVRDCPPSERGFLLHSYAGPADMIPRWVKAGAFFSFSPAFLHPRKAPVRGMFREIPVDRLLVETDCPDMAPPGELALLPLRDEAGKWINHPLNLRLCLEALAADRGLCAETLGAVLERNAERLFFDPARDKASAGGGSAPAGIAQPRRDLF
jgi:TatD DNase family protein